MTSIGPFKRYKPGSAAISGTATGGIAEADIVAGGDTIIITLTGDTWVASGTAFDAQRQNIINGLDSAQAEAAGWDAVVKASLPVSSVVRTSDTVVTITLTAQATYDITAQETITVTVPGTALHRLTSPLVGSPTFTVDIDAVNYGEYEFIIDFIEDLTGSYSQVSGSLTAANSTEAAAIVSDISSNFNGTLNIVDSDGSTLHWTEVLNPAAYAFISPSHRIFHPSQASTDTNFIFAQSGSTVDFVLFEYVDDNLFGTYGVRVGDSLFYDVP